MPLVEHAQPLSDFHAYVLAELRSQVYQVYRLSDLSCNFLLAADFVYRLSDFSSNFLLAADFVSAQ